MMTRVTLTNTERQARWSGEISPSRRTGSNPTTLSASIYRRLGAVLLDPDVGDDELRAPTAVHRVGGAAARGPVRPGELDAGRPEGPLRADRRAAGLSQFAGPVLSRMKFVDEQGEGASPTLSALRAYLEHPAAVRRGVPPGAPLDFAPAALQPLIRRDGVTDRRRWESALFLKVRDEIQTGNLAIDGAKNFGRFEAFFLPADRWERVREAFWARTGPRRRTSRSTPTCCVTVSPIEWKNVVLYGEIKLDPAKLKMRRP